MFFWGGKDAQAFLKNIPFYSTAGVVIKPAPIRTLGDLF